MSKKLKPTPWFPACMSPARDGVYEVIFIDTPGFARYFNRPPAGSSGNHWSALYFSPKEASRVPPGGSMKPRWRGLAEKPIPAGRTKENP